MVNFSDLGIKDESSSFLEEKVSINDVVNSEIIVHDFKANVPTQNGNRHLIKIEIDSQKRVIFTGSHRIIDALESKKIKFPFKTVIKTFKVGTKRAFMFT